MTQHSIVGTWRLVRFHARNAKGNTRPALGENAQGLLVYTAEGYMIAILSEAGRAPFRSDDFRGATPEEALLAVKSYISYSGRYTVGERTVTHHVEASLFPNWIGQDQVRSFRFEQGNLILGTPPVVLSGGEWTFELLWERAL